MSYEAAVKADAPSLFWPLTEASGTTAKDASGSGRDGTFNTSSGLAGATVLPGRPAWDPTNGRYITRAYDAALSPGSGDWLLSFWRKGAVLASGGSYNYEPILCRDVGATGNGIIAYVAGTGTGIHGATPGSIRLWCAGVVRNGTTTITDGNPHHVWLERRSGLVTCYVDGVADPVINAYSMAGSCNGSGSPLLEVGAVENVAGAAAQSGGATAFYAEAPLGMMAFWVGTIPAATRRTAHYQAGIRSGVATG